MLNKVEIKNIANHNVGITVEDLRLHRTIRPSQSIFLKEEILEEALSYPGVKYLFDNKYLIILDTEKAVELGAIDENTLEVSENENKFIQKNVQDKEEILKIINNGTPYELKKLLDNESKDRQLEIAEIAAEAEGLTMSKIELIKNIVGVDLSKTVK